MGRELEIKLALASAEDLGLASRLGREAGRVFQDNRFFDFPDAVLRRARWALRLRREWPGQACPNGPAGAIVLTLKGPAHNRSGAVERWEYEWPISQDSLRDLFRDRITLAQTAELTRKDRFWAGNPLLERVMNSGLGSLVQVAWFRNKRVRHLVDLQGKPWVLEVDETHFPSGETRYEVELEIDDEGANGESIESLRQALLDLLSRNTIVVTGPGRGKYSTALEEMKKIMQWNVPRDGCLLRFDVLSKARVWGGHKLAERYGKPPAPEGQPCGETWEIVDLPKDQSRVSKGPLQGATLGELRSQHLDWLMGKAALLEGRFPLLLKLIDASRTLSVQVHPDEEAAAKLHARPKTECWVILDAEPGASLYLGLKPGVTREQLREACKGPTLEALLNKVEVRPLDVVFIPAGTVHAIGEGLVLAELQQASDTTYRLHDWGRMGLDGKPRQLHVDQALESIHFHMPDPPPWKPRRGPGRVISSRAFDLELLQWETTDEPGRELSHDEPLVLLALTGSVLVSSGQDSERLTAGRSALAPAASRHTKLAAEEPNTWVLVGRPA